MPNRNQQTHHAPSRLAGASHARAYTDEVGHLRPALFDAEAQAEARDMEKIAHTQLRRFFGQVIADKRRFDLKREAGQPPDDSEAQVAMVMLKAKTAYAGKRERKNLPLAEFAEHHVKLVRTIEDFTHFSRHFEAVVAWHRVFEKKKGG